MTSDKKRQKTEAKLAKKQAKAELKREQAGASSPDAPASPSPAVRYAESVRGILYVVMGASLVGALILGQRGVIVSLDDLVDSLFAARTGKVLLTLIAIALLIYGLKHLRLVR